MVLDAGVLANVVAWRGWAVQGHDRGALGHVLDMVEERGEGQGGDGQRWPAWPRHALV